MAISEKKRLYATYFLNLLWLIPFTKSFVMELQLVSTLKI